MLDIYCDGSYKNGIGTWAYAIFRDENIIDANAGRVPDTHYNSNNLAELVAIIEGIRAMPLDFTGKVFTDSVYCTHGYKNLHKVKKGRYSTYWVQLEKLMQCGRYSLHWVRSKTSKKHDMVDAIAKNELSTYL